MAAVIASRISLRVFRYVVVAVTAAGSVSLLVREAVSAVCRRSAIFTRPSFCAPGCRDYGLPVVMRLRRLRWL